MPHGWRESDGRLKKKRCHATCSSVNPNLTQALVNSLNGVEHDSSSLSESHSDSDYRSGSPLNSSGRQVGTMNIRLIAS